MSGRPNDEVHLDAEALDRYRRRNADPAELLAADAHIAHCDRCHAAVRVEPDAIELPPPEHLAYEELEAFVDGRADALDRDLVAAHIAQCARCGNELTDLLAAREATGPGLPAQPPRSTRPRT